MLKKKRFYIIVIIALGLLSSSYYLVSSLEKNFESKTINGLKEKQKNQQSFIALYLERFFHHNTSELILLKELIVNHQQANNSQFQSISDIIMVFSQNNPEYIQIKYLDKNGQELIRVDNSKEPRLIAKEELQNKKDQYYFQKSIALENNEIYYSYFDLNKEHIEKEYLDTPSISLYTPLFVNNEVSGIIGMNVKANELLDEVKKQGVILLNSENIVCAGDSNLYKKFTYDLNNERADNGNTLITFTTIRLQKYLEYKIVSKTDLKSYFSLFGNYNNRVILIVGGSTFLVFSVLIFIVVQINQKEKLLLQNKLLGELKKSSTALEENKKIELEKHTLSQDLEDAVLKYKELYQQLIKSNAALKKAQEIGNIGHWEYDMNKKVLFCSDQLYSIFKLPLSERTNNYKDFLNIVHPEDQKKVMKTFTDSVQNKQPYELELRLLFKDNSIKYVLEKCETIFTKEGVLVKSIGTIQDITDRVNYEKKLIESEERYKGLSDLSMEGIIIHLNGIILDTNKASCNIFGYSQQELIGSNAFETLVYPEDLPLVTHNVNNKIESPYQARFIKKDGTVLDIEVKAKNVPFQGQDVRVAVLADMTERNKLINKIKSSEDKFRSIFNNASDAIFIHDLEGHFLEANEATVNLLGYDHNAFLQMELVDIVADKYTNRIKSRLNKIIKEDFFVFESCHKNKDNQEIPVEVNARIIEYQNKPCILSVVRNITDRIKAQQSLKESEEKFRLFFEENSAVMFQVDPETRKIVNCNNSAVTFYGYSKEEFIGLPLDAFNIMGLAEIKKKMESTIQNKSFRFETSHRLKNGEIRDVEVFASVIPFSEGIQFFSIINDITDRRLYEKKLFNSIKETADIRNALDQSAIVAITDPMGKITYVNDKFCKISQYTEQELIGFDHSKVNSGYHPKEFIGNLWKTIKQGNIWTGEIKNRAKDGSFYWVDTTIVPSLDTNGVPTQYVSIRKDISSRKIAEELLDKERKSTLQAQFEGEEREKNRISAELHDGLGQILTAARLSLAALENNSSLNNSIKVQLKDIKNLVTEANLETHRISNKLLPRVLEDYGLIVAVKRLLEDISQTLDIETNFISDSSLDICKKHQIAAYRIIQESVNNAIKYSKCTKLSVSFDIKNESNIFTITDNGSGIDPEKEQNGLGLRNMKQRARSVDGTLDIQSDINKGTNIILKFNCNCEK